MVPDKRISHARVYVSGNISVKAFLIILFLLPILCIPDHAVVAQQDNQLFSFDISIVWGYCQISIWIEDSSGTVIKTICVSNKTAKQGLGTYRPHVLPVWAFRHGETYGENSIYPTTDDPLPDAITTASPPSGQLEKSWEPAEPVAGGEYYFYVEINKAYDSNDYFSDGEPSVIWRGTVTVGNEDDSGDASIIGHGDENGDNGTIYSDMTYMTLSTGYMTGATLVYTAGSPTNSPPQITTISLPIATEDITYSCQIEASDPDIGDTVSFSLLAGPDWLNLSPEGLLSGTPASDDVAVDIPVTIRASDSGGLADTLATTITVATINHPPEITTESLPDATVGLLYSQTVIATDPDIGDTVSFGFLTGPDWLNLSPEGVLTGTPVEDDIGDNILVSIRATDESGLADTLTTSLNVIPVTAVREANGNETVILLPPYPNPCNAGTTIGFELPSECAVYMAIYDMLGRTVNVLVNSRMSSGRYEVWWDGKDAKGDPVGTGSYFYTFRSGPYLSGGKITVLK